MVVVLMGVLFLLARHKRPPPGPVGPWPADLGLGAVDPQLDPIGGGVGEHVRQGVQPHTRRVGDGEATCGQQRPDFMDGAGDGGAVDPVQHRQGLVGQLQAQDHQGGQDPVTQDEALVGAGAGGALAWVAAALLEGAVVRGSPRAGQFGERLGEVLPGQPGEDRMGEGRTGPCWRRHPRMMTVRPVSCPSGSAHDQPCLSLQVGQAGHMS
jgi:hypothetical protein